MNTLGEVVRVAQPQKKELKVVKAPTAEARFAFQKLRVPRVGAVLPTPDEREKALEEFKQFKADVAASMFDCVQNVRAIEAMSKDEAELYVEEFRQSQAAIKEMLSYSEAAHIPALVSYADATIKTCPRNKGAIETTLFKLVSVGFLAEADTDKEAEVRAYGKRYNVPMEFAKAPETRPIINAILGLINEVTLASRRLYEESFNNLSRQVGPNQLSIEELKAGKNGRVFLRVPDNKTVDRFYRGGFILVESTGTLIKLIGAVGGPQRVSENVIKLTGFVPVSSLGGERLMLENHLDDEGQFRACCMLHTWLTLAVKAVEEEVEKENRKVALAAQFESERQSLIPKATISIPEFVLSDRTGLAFLDFGRKPFEIRNNGDRSKLVFEVFCVVERNDAGHIRVANCPERLEGFFAESLEFKHPGVDFRNLGRLGQILRKKVGEVKNS